MLYAMIALSVLTLALLVFVVLALRWLAFRVTSSIREKSIDLIGCYDELLAEKSGELKKINIEIEEKQAQIDREENTAAASVLSAEESSGPEDISPYSVLNAVERAGTAQSRDKATAGIYKTIRGGFCYDSDEVIDGISESLGTRQEGIATAVLRELDYSLIFRLSTLPSEEQYRLLYDSLYDEALPLLEEYNGTHYSFDAIGFYDYLKLKAGMEPGPIRLIVPSDFPEEKRRDGIEIEENDQIVEGFMVEADTTVYDYSVRESEIS